MVGYGRNSCGWWNNSNYGKVIHMADWTIKGSPEGFEGHPECTTDFYSDFKVIGPDGNPIHMNSMKRTDGVPLPQWIDIPEGSKFQWKIKTMSDGEGKSDRANIELKWFDSNYVAQITNDAMNQLTDEQIMSATTNPEEFLELIMPIIKKNLNSTLLLKTIFSDTLTTDSEGDATGTIDILPQWPKGAYNFIAHYGYSHEAEKSTGEKTEDVWIEEYIPLIMDAVLIIAGFVFTGGIASAVIISAEFATFAYEMSFIAMDYYRTQMGWVGVNQYDCSFPLSGFVHAYSMTYKSEEAAEEMATLLDEPNIALASAIDKMLIAKGLTYTVGVGAISIAIIMILLNRIKGGK